jgi:hypothetical protein
LQAEQRGLAQAKLRIGKENVWFFNCHLSAAGTNNGENGPVERARQVTNHTHPSVSIPHIQSHTLSPWPGG